jgi:hypothetical protein
MTTQPPQPPEYRVKYFPCGSNLPVVQADVSTWPVYSSNNVPDIAGLQAQLASFDSTIMPTTSMYLWDANARRPSPLKPTDTLRPPPLKPTDTLPPGDTAVLVFAKPEFGQPNSGALAAQLVEISSNLAAVRDKLKSGGSFCVRADACITLMMRPLTHLCNCITGSFGR